MVVTVIATGFDEKIMNAKSTDNAAPKGGRASGRNADEGGKGSDEDDPYKEIFKIFNRERISPRPLIPDRAQPAVHWQRAVFGV